MKVRKGCAATMSKTRRVVLSTLLSRASRWQTRPYGRALDPDVARIKTAWVAWGFVPV